MLTASQKKCLDYIIGYQSTHGGISPCYNELAAGLGVVSRGNVHRLVLALEERGKIRRTPNRARAIEVIARPGPQPALGTSPRSGLGTGSGGLALGLVPRVPVVSYPNAQYFVVERVDEKAVLVPLNLETRK